ncbi:MAG: nucleotidyltransferase family protein [Candidatus Schekmanbacteria bacterium]|nr:nucleotidyltransferase family protein [Candidatus Schekmanbacteria bacterium]
MEKRFISDYFDKLPDDQRLLLTLSSLSYLKNPAKENSGIDLAQNSIWDRAMGIFFNTGLSNIIFYNLKQTGHLNSIPIRVKEKLEQLYHSNAARNLLIMNILKHISEITLKHGKEIMLMQGTALISSVYEHPSLRYLSDIDIMVKSSEVLEFEKILLENGFKCSNFPGNTKWCIDNLNHLPHYYYQDFASPLEVHFKFAEIFTGVSPQTNWFWEGKTLLPETQNIFIPSPENLMLSISLHISKKSHITDLTMLPRHCCDMDAIFSKCGNTLLSDSFIKKTVDLNLAEPLYYSCRIGAFVLSSEKFEELAEKLKPLVSPSLLRFTETMVDNILAGINTKITLAGWETFFMQPTLVKKVIFFLRHICPPVSTMKEIYGPPASGGMLLLYYLYRPFHLLRIFSFKRVKTSSILADIKKRH